MIVDSEEDVILPLAIADLHSIHSLVLIHTRIQAGDVLSEAQALDCLGNVYHSLGNDCALPVWATNQIVSFLFTLWLFSYVVSRGIDDYAYVIPLIPCRECDCATKLLI